MYRRPCFVSMLSRESTFRNIRQGILPILFLTLAPMTPAPAAAAEAGIHPAAVAGSFYPAEAGKLRGAVDFFLGHAIEASGEKPVALLVPHAGWIFSGQIMADAYAQARGHAYDVIVILGTNHTTARFGGVSIWPDGGYRTPLGVARVDQELAGRLIAMDPRFTFDRRLHGKEHSIEVHIPFLQSLFPDTPVLITVVGRPDPDLCHDLGQALVEVVEGREALFIVSSDLSHYPDLQTAMEADKATLIDLVSLDPGVFDEKLVPRVQRLRSKNLSTCVCGEASLRVLMEILPRMGCEKARVLSYANSGQTILGAPERVVGYGALAFYSGLRRSDISILLDKVPSRPSELGSSEKEQLLQLARETITAYLEYGVLPLPRGDHPAFHELRGAFVTLKKNGRLRGCIGRMIADQPMQEVVGRMALSAATEDHRFTPVSRDEVEDLHIEISLLTPMQPVDSYRDIVVGRDGVLLQKHGFSAVFLPQVATEQDWDLQTMLGHLSLKAGLDENSWKQGAHFSVFQAEVFEEERGN